jgi:hypothetical protein
MEPIFHTITVTITNQTVIESLYNICHIISKRMNKDHLILMFIKSNNRYDMCVTTETIPEEKDNENLKSAQYLITNDPSILDIECRNISGNKVISVEALNFYLLLKTKKICAQNDTSKFNLIRSKVHLNFPT